MVSEKLAASDGKDIFVTPEVAPRVRKARELSSGSR